MAHRGKQFEAKFAEDFSNIPNCSMDRLFDTMNGYKYVSNVSDFICYVYPNEFYIECKAIKGNTFPLSNLTQYDKLLAKKGILGVRAGAVVWFQDHDVVCYVPVATFEQLKKEGKKSVNIKMLDDSCYNIKVLPSIKKRVFLDTDYTLLTQLKEGE